VQNLLLSSSIRLLWITGEKVEQIYFDFDAQQAEEQDKNEMKELDEAKKSITEREDNSDGLHRL